MILECFGLKRLLSAALVVAGLAVVWLYGVPVSGEEIASQRSADTLMQIAHDGRAEWDGFPGFTAKLVVSADGQVAQGTINVSADGKSVYTLDHAQQQSEAFNWVQRSLDSLIRHRLASSEAISNLEFADDQVHHPHGRLLRSKDPENKNLWRVQGDVLTEVQRTTENSRFIISVGDVWRTAENKHLPKNFAVTTWEMPSNRIQTARQVYTEWTRVGRFDLPVKNWAITNKSDGTTVTHQIEISGHQLSVTTTRAD